ncbi:MAG TPA: hypothetical protein VF418_07280 [Sphingomonadaceae bacterium]
MGRKLTGGFRSSQIGESCLAQLTRSRKKRDAALDAIKAACEAHINGPLFKELADIIEATAGRTGMSAEGFHVMPHRDDSQTLMVHYPTATPVDGYIDKVVKIESGAKSALDPIPYARFGPMSPTIGFSDAQLYRARKYPDLATSSDLAAAIALILAVDAERMLRRVAERCLGLAMHEPCEGTSPNGPLREF